jgi:hypothetical protein
LPGKDSSTTAVSDLAPKDDKLGVSTPAEVVVVLGALRVRW